MLWIWPWVIIKKSGTTNVIRTKDRAWLNTFSNTLHQKIVWYQNLPKMRILKHNLIVALLFWEGATSKFKRGRFHSGKGQVDVGDHQSFPSSESSLPPTPSDENKTSFTFGFGSCLIGVSMAPVLPNWKCFNRIQLWLVPWQSAQWHFA